MKGVTVVLDKSGSMHGRKIETCKKTLKELFDYSHKELNNDKINLFLFNTGVDDLDTYEKTLK